MSATPPLSLPKAADSNVARCTRLRRLLESTRTEFIMEAHNGISARIVEEAGFPGIWASGLSLSAQFGVRDNNEASWTQVVEMLEFMSDATTIPILLDGDTGYGNFNNMRRLVQKLEQREIAGVCIEDKLFPKTNSFIAGERQPLADIDEFCGKIKAGKDIQRHDDFCIVARVEALIAGWGLAEALRRAEAYHAAGADAILIHSKLSRPDQILEFTREWGNRCPVVIVPTKYYSTPTEVFRKAGINLVIWANHMLRAAVAAMQDVAARVRESESLIEIEDRIAPVEEIFRLQGADELAEAERRYFGDRHVPPRAIVLAASRGRALAGLTEDRPKVMLPVGGRPLLRRLVDSFKKRHIHDITVVTGYKAETITVEGIRQCHNPDYADTGELHSLLCARDHFGEDMVISYGDLLFRGYILEDLLEKPHAVTVVVDSAVEGRHISGSPDYAWCSAPDDRSMLDQQVSLRRIGDRGDQEPAPPSGRWIGLMRVQGEGRQWLEHALDELSTREDFHQLGLPELLNHLVAQGREIRVFYINGHWLDVNTLEDLDLAGSFTHHQRETE